MPAPIGMLALTTAQPIKVLNIDLFYLQIN